MGYEDDGMYGGMAKVFALRRNWMQITRIRAHKKIRHIK